MSALGTQHRPSTHPATDACHYIPAIVILASDNIWDAQAFNRNTAETSGLNRYGYLGGKPAGERIRTACQFQPADNSSSKPQQHLQILPYPSKRPLLAGIGRGTGSYRPAARLLCLLCSTSTLCSRVAPAVFPSLLQRMALVGIWLHAAEYLQLSTNQPSAKNKRRGGKLPRTTFPSVHEPAECRTV